MVNLHFAYQQKNIVFNWKFLKYYGENMSFSSFRIGIIKIKTIVVSCLTSKTCSTMHIKDYTLCDFMLRIFASIELC